MTAAQHPHDPFRPATAGDAPPAPAPIPEPEPTPEPAPKPKRKRGRRAATPKSDNPAENTGGDPEDELAQALADLDEKDAARDDSAG